MSKKPIYMLLILIFIMSLAGCASVKYDREKVGKDDLAPGTVTRNYGVPFYEAKPYLMLVRGKDANGNPTVSASIISLPDKRYRYRARTTSGFGSTSADLTLQNGVLVSTSSSASNTDTLAGLIGATATAAGVPSTIAMNASQALLNQAEAEAKKKGLAVAELFTPQKAKLDCTKRLTTLPWRQNMDSALALIRDLNVNDKVPLQQERKSKLIEEINNWISETCRNDDLHFVTSRKNRLGAILKFQKAASKHYSSLKKLSASLDKLAGLLGCDCSTSNDCSNINTIKTLFKETLTDLATYVPAAQPAMFELWEVVYDPDSGEFEKFNKVFPK